MYDTWIIIVNWNGKDNTVECLESIQKLKQKVTRVHTLVVDNHSTDNSVEEIALHYPGVRIHVTNENIGFTGGNNVGIELALQNNADFIWLLNNDTIVHEDTLDKLIPQIEDESIGLASPKIYFYPGNEFHFDRYQKNDRGKVIWYAGGLVDWKNVYASHKGVDEVDHGQFDKSEETGFISGCAMLIKSKVIKDVGLLDHKYFLYLEDLDYSLKVKSHGYKLLYVGSSWIWHKNAGSTSKPGNDLHEYYLTRNRILFGFRYASLRAKIALLKQSIFYLLSGNKVRKKAVIDALLGKYGKRYIWKN